MEIKVYTRPACPQCTATCRTLDRRGIDYRLIDLDRDPQAHEHVVALGHRQLPVVEAGEQHWSGFRPDRLGSLIPA
ncbi:glutaredoxin-like protein NrdH [Halomonas halodenitrificans]|uniref:glutaredoxin-like protein NrdH n=1 Tax=Halomonas halodenitrificans TaxID=28252 RepID=UPI00047F3B8E|nr:glutaredoxin-like protein NrdH [Halomonas halodenitrificans]